MSDSITVIPGRAEGENPEARGHLSRVGKSVAGGSWVTGSASPPRNDKRAPRSPAAAETFATVTDLAKDLSITARAIRFYEDKGLITPRRIGTTRVYSNRERARMILILRGKRLSFSLREIKDYLDLYDADPRRVTQTRALLMKLGERRKQLLEQREAIVEALEGLDDLERDANAILARAGARRERTTKV